MTGARSPNDVAYVLYEEDNGQNAIVFNDNPPPHPPKKATYSKKNRKEK